MTEIVWALFIFFVITQVFWAIVTIRLVNRVMSRDFSEFAQVERFRQARPKPKAEEVTDGEDQKRAEEINRLMGIV